MKTRKKVLAKSSSQYALNQSNREKRRALDEVQSGASLISIIVHHRVPGKSVLGLMISLCPACHAKIHRTRVVVRLMPALLLALWREQHPTAHEQTALNFSTTAALATPVELFLSTHKECST